MKSIILKATGGLIATLLSLWLGGFILFSVYTLTTSPADANEKTDAIVVLTGGNYRIQTGLDLLAKGAAPKLLITGVHEKVTVEDILKNWKSEQPPPNCCISLGHKALTTYDNADEAKEWIEKNGIASIRLVTSDYHMARALIEFRRSIPGLKTVPHPVEEKDYGFTDWTFWQLAFSEYHKILFRLLRLSLQME
ncbi:MAG: YdcF family protein [Alphaproteobacteria bacterium]|nr:YdcF family protein [Alphaproteobacteria bacterium]MCB9974779.1 YdcF family protein [Rhodospirillales bacterium]